LLTLAGLIAGTAPPDVPLAVAACGTGGISLSWVQGRWPDGSIVATHDRFYAASLAKQLTGAAIAILVRRGELGADRPIGTWLPDLPAWRRDVTVRMLLHHVGGLPEAGVYEAGLGTNHLTNAGALNYLRGLERLPFIPGTMLRYSNLGYICLAEIVAAASGVPFARFVDREIVSPLGLSGMGFCIDGAALPFPQAGMLGATLPLSAGDGGLWSTAEAYVRWLDSQNRDALAIAALAEKPYRLPSGATTDYGWGIGLRQFRGSPLYIHAGSWQGASAKAVRLPEAGLAVVALAATSRFEPVAALVDRLLEALADGLTD
jgi:CubicO group peptidase (beta-lactamase class C family)